MYKTGSFHIFKSYTYTQWKAIKYYTVGVHSHAPPTSLVLLCSSSAVTESAAPIRSSSIALEEKGDRHSLISSLPRHRLAHLICSSGDTGKSASGAKSGRVTESQSCDWNLQTQSKGIAEALVGVLHERLTQRAATTR